MSDKIIVSFRDLITKILNERYIIHHGELIPLLCEFSEVSILTIGSVHDLLDTIDSMVFAGELFRVEYTLPDSDNRRYKSILFHRDAQVFVNDHAFRVPPNRED